MRILWLYCVDSSAGLRNGVSLRVLNLSRELIGKGHEVYLAGFSDPPANGAKDEAYLSELIRNHTISGSIRLDYSYSYGRVNLIERVVRIAAFRVLMGYPPFANRILRKYQRPIGEFIRDLANASHYDAIVIGERRLYFLLTWVSESIPVYVDFVDSRVLAARRLLHRCLQRQAWLKAINQLQRLLWAEAEERYYGRRSRANFVASPIDRLHVAHSTGNPDQTFVVLNGVESKKTIPPVPKIRGRLIFSGNMDFSPNHEAATWFIDEVLPLVRAKRPDVQFVIAGANPLPALLARQSNAVQVLGFVEDLAAEIAKAELYVAPLVSGGGFKNKVVEALLAGTFLASTTMGVEFLPQNIQRELLVGDHPCELAAQIVAFLADSAVYSGRLGELQHILRTEFTWEARAEELILHLRAACGESLVPCVAQGRD